LESKSIRNRKPVRNSTDEIIFGRRLQWCVLKAPFQPCSSGRSNSSCFNPKYGIQAASRSQPLFGTAKQLQRGSYIFALSVIMVENVWSFTSTAPDIFVLRNNTPVKYKII
jgi:hypothetical protein